MPGKEKGGGKGREGKGVGGEYRHRWEERLGNSAVASAGVNEFPKDADRDPSPSTDLDGRRPRRAAGSKSKVTRHAFEHENRYADLSPDADA